MNRTQALKTFQAWADQQKSQGKTISADDCSIYLKAIGLVDVDFTSDDITRLKQMKAETLPIQKHTAVAKHVAKQRAAKKTLDNSPATVDESLDILAKLFSGEPLTEEDDATIKKIMEQPELVNA